MKIPEPPPKKEDHNPIPHVQNIPPSQHVIHIHGKPTTRRIPLPNKYRVIYGLSLLLLQGKRGKFPTTNGFNLLINGCTKIEN